MRDIDVREALRLKTLQRYYHDGSSKVVEELGIFQGLSRIDIAVVNGSLYGYEIKSESDTLYRLDVQLSYYRQVFDYLTFVTGAKHEAHMRELLPEWCGIIVATSKPNEQLPKLVYSRKAKKNPDINAMALAQLLWKDELLSILSEKSIKKGLSRKSKRDLYELVAANYSVKELSRIVRDILKTRIDWRAGQ